MLSLFECLTCSSSLSLEKMKLIAIVNYIFHLLSFFSLFMISFKYDLILLTYFSTDIVLFILPLLSYSI